VLDVSYRPSVTPSLSRVEYVTTSISHAATVNGMAYQATGSAQVRDGTSVTIVIGGAAVRGSVTVHD
jgi:hypothetical protein